MSEEWAISAIRGSGSWAKLNPGASEDAIRAAQDKLKVVFPPSFTRFLRLWNGGEFGSDALYGIPPITPHHLDITWYREEILDARDCPKSWIPIANDGCGNYFVIATEIPTVGAECAIGFVDYSVSPTNITNYIATNYWAFLEFFIRLMAGDKDVIHGAPIEPPGLRPWPWDEDWLAQNDPYLSKIGETRT
jgi:cell wall assembly regulator SMI1